MTPLTTYHDYKQALKRIDELWGSNSSELYDAIEAVCQYEDANPAVLDHDDDVPEEQYGPIDDYLWGLQ